MKDKVEKDLQGSGHDLIMKYLGTGLEEMRKTINNIYQDR